MTTKGQSPFTSDESSFLIAKTYFQNELKEDAHLYTGKEYYKYEPGIKGIPFFMTEVMQTGDLLYDGTLYKNVPLLYDLVRQVVVIDQYQQEDTVAY